MDDASTCSQPATTGNLIISTSSPFNPFHLETGYVSKFVSNSDEFIPVNDRDGPVDNSEDDRTTWTHERLDLLCSVHIPVL